MSIENYKSGGNYMKDDSFCPYCGKEMHLGSIYQDRFALKWIPGEKDKGFLLQAFSKGIKLTDLTSNGSVESLYCNECEKIIIDTKNKLNQNL